MASTVDATPLSWTSPTGESRQCPLAAPGKARGTGCLVRWLAADYRGDGFGRAVRFIWLCARG